MLDEHSRQLLTQLEVAMVKVGAVCAEPKGLKIDGVSQAQRCKETFENVHMLLLELEILIRCN